jgi:two-component system sensor histidine kinase HydH
MLFENKQNNGSRITTSPLIIFGSRLILLIILVVLAIQNYNREKQYMVKTMNEKGVAFIKAVEAGARTGMMGMGWGKQQVQALVQETGQLHDVFL